MFSPKIAPLLVACAVFGPAQSQDFELTIVHTNDVHARVEPVSVSGRPLGGYARVATAIKQIRMKAKNPIVLNAGDTFQGTLYFNQYAGLADAHLMNLIGYQAMTLGNHEFDRGPEALSAFAKVAKFPLLAANLDVSQEPTLKDWVRASTVIEVGGQKVGIVGAITEDLVDISSPGPTVKLNKVVPTVQAEVDRLTKGGINKIVLLSHCGYDVDLDLANKLNGVDVIVGGHSHSLLGTLQGPGIPRPLGAYPTMLEVPAEPKKPMSSKGKIKTLVVQAWEWGKVVGSLGVRFSSKGEILAVTQATTTLIDPSIAEDPLVKGAVDAFAVPIAAVRKAVVGEAKEPLSQGPLGNRRGESPVGNVICDAMLEAVKPLGAKVVLWNAGGIRSTVDSGPITYDEAFTVLPFNNTLVVLDLTGAELKAAFEHGVSTWETGSGGFLHTSKGLLATIDPSKPAGSRVVKLEIEGEPVVAGTVYRVAVNSFMAQGGDAHAALKEAKGYRYDSGFVDIDAFIDYLKKNAPVSPKVEGRIVVLGN